MRKKKWNRPEFIDEDREWLYLTPAQRILETTKLWKFYIALGGSLDPESDPQSPFYFKDIEYWTPLKKELEMLRRKKVAR